MKAFENSSTQSKIIYLFIFCLAGLFLAGSLVTVLNGFSDNQLMQSVWGMRISSVIQIVLMFFMPAVTLIMWSGNEPVSYLKVRYYSGMTDLLILAFLLLLVSAPFISLLSHLNQMLILPDWLNGLEVWMKTLEQKAEETTNMLLSDTSILSYLANILVIGVFAAIAEEVFFRGALQQLLVKLFKNKHAGVWMAAFIFSLMHLQFYGFLPRLILGALLGYLFAYSKNLWMPIIIHFLNNSLVITFNFFFKNNTVYQSIENPSLTPTFVLLGLTSLSLMIYVLGRYQKKATQMLSTTSEK